MVKNEKFCINSVEQIFLINSAARLKSNFRKNSLITAGNFLRMSANLFLSFSKLNSAKNGTIRKNEIFRLCFFAELEALIWPQLRKIKFKVKLKE